MDLSIALEQALATLTENDISEILSSVDTVSWIESRRVLKGKPFSLKNKKYNVRDYYVRKDQFIEDRL